MQHAGTGGAEEPRLVVGVGASAGGLEAFKQFLTALPGDSGMAFLLVQHLDPTQGSLLTELLGPHTRMAVREAEQGVTLERDTIYVIRPDTALAVREGRIELSAPTLRRGVRLPVDHLLRSLAREYGERAVGIVLSGAGSDGTAGVRDIKVAGGLTIAQDPPSCGQSGMPRSAIDTGLVDLVLRIEEIPEALERFASLRPVARRGTVAAAAEGDDSGHPSTFSEPQLDQLADLLRENSAFDLDVYKRATVERRVLRRMSLSGFTDVESYFAHLRRTPAERQIIVRDLLISVTDFFRDPESFRALREMVVDPLVRDMRSGGRVRIWVPGCATGAEAYSIAIEVFEAIEALDARATVQVFATDIDREALDYGRAGTYPPSTADHVSRERLEKYFEAIAGKGYRVRSSLRDVVSFALHDVTKDPPFSRMNLVSCRNVLIYLTPEAQRNALNVFHFALAPGGSLFLSSSESTGSQRELFATLSTEHRIYRKVGASPSMPLEPSRRRSLADVAEPSRSAAAPTSREPRRVPADDQARRAVLEACVPPTIIVSEDGTVTFMHGELGPYLRFPQGDAPRLELTSLLRPALATRVRRVWYTCRRKGETAVALSSSDDRSGRRVRISARPALSLEAGAVVLSFEDVEAERVQPEAPGRPDRTLEGGVIGHLEHELEATREDLRNTVEELETANEALRTSNEVSMSMNEELQSANEELEATTEELRSLNEELTAVNAQLRDKVTQLEEAHDDLSNFFSSTEIATVFLDERLCIKRFTPAARDLLGIDDLDKGRAISEATGELFQHGLVEDARAVLEELTPRSCEIRTSFGRWLARRVLPYRTDDGRIEGVVATFVDVTDLKEATERLTLRERQQSVVALLGQHALREGDLQALMERSLREMQETMGADYSKILELQPGGSRLLLRAGVGWRDGLIGSAYVDADAESQAGYTLQTAGPVIVLDLNEERRFSGPSLLTDHGVVSGLSCVIRDGSHVYGVLGAHTRERRVFTQEDANFLQAVAGVLGAAIGRHQTRLRLAVELGVASVLSEVSDLDEGLPRLLGRVTYEMRGFVGELWWPSDGGTLRRRLLHVERAGEAERVRATFEAIDFEPGQGLIGRVYQQGRASWCTDLGDPHLFVRRDTAESLGLVSGLGIPVRAGAEVLGVMAIFADHRMIADDVFLRSLEGIGRSIGDFVVQSEYERRARRLAAITESSHDAIFSYDHDGRVIEWLAGAERLFGYTADEMIGSSIERIVPEHLLEEFRGIRERIDRDEPGDVIETTRLSRDGASLEVSVRSSPVRNREGEVVAVSSTVRDITRRKETERQLVQADRQKDEFLAMLGHELRNPLAAIRSATELLKLSGGGVPTLEQTQAILERQTTHMAKLLDGLLDVSRIIRGKIRLEPEVLNFAALCHEVAADVTERESDRHLEIETDVPAEPIWVDADRVRLTQIVDNLLSNAVKYTPDGGRVTLSLVREESMAVLSIRDTGIGIDPELLPHVFDVFRQSRQTLDRSFGGLGLGLALVRSLADLHGGSAEARSEGKDRGSEFRVRIPIAPGARARPTGTSAGEAAALSLVLIEDNADAAEMLSQVLALAGHTVAVAPDGVQGVALTRERVPDVVLCDLGLPGDMTGFDVARAIRADAETRGVRLIALSGYGRTEDKARGAEAGFDAHLTKPMDVQALQRALSELGLSGRA